MVFTLPGAMKYTLVHDDPLYFTDETDMVIFDHVQKVLAMNPLEDYMEELDIKEDKGKLSAPSLVQHELWGDKANTK